MAELQQIQNLRREIGEFRRSMLDAIASERGREPANARALLRRELNPKRDAVIGMSEDLQALNRNSFIDQQRARADLYAITQGQMWRQLGIAMLSGLSIALVATVYASRLERRLRVQRDQEIRNAHDLQRLSARVIRVQEEERRAIARELHDEVGQVLTAIKVELAKVQRAIEAGGGDGLLLQNTRAIADGALHTVKDLSRLLHPAVLDDLGLSSAVEWHLKEFGRRHGLRVEFEQAHMDQRLPSAVELAVYRVVQEALTNVARHAGATWCSVSLRRWPEVLVVRIEDNGVGFDLERPNQLGGLGLIGIRERIAELDGHLRIDSEPGRGTRVLIDLPVQPLQPLELSFDAEVPVTEPAVGGQVG
jgi:signal transduction histidine kinase